MIQTTANFGTQIESFLESTLAKTSPTWIVTVERKGTALLRTLFDRTGSRSPWTTWEHVLSHEALSEVPGDQLRQGTILLLDDTVHRGARIRDVLNQLTEEKGVPRTNIKVAAFGVHERSARDCTDFHWFGQLNDVSYKIVREGVVEFFQRRGSLLLDTEHIEVPVDVRCGRLEFFEALSQAGVAVEHLSGGGRVNLTIYDPWILDQDRLMRSLPAGTVAAGTVKKIRVVERDNDRYAIIPIFYPSIPSDTRAESLCYLVPPLAALAGSADRNSHLVGVFAAMQLFKTVFTCLRELISQQKVWVRNPLPGDADDCLSHLKVLFPSIDVTSLHRCVQEAIDAGRSHRPKRGELRKPLVIDAGPGTSAWRRLEISKWYLLRRVLEYWDSAPAGPRGPCMAEIFHPVRARSYPSDEERLKSEALLSAALDQAIDEALVGAHMADMTFSDGRERKVRVFFPDNELVRTDLRKAAALWRSTPPWMSPGPAGEE